MSTISPLTRPAGAPGQRTRKGTRTPPSQVVPLSPRKGEVPPSGHMYW